MTQVIIRKTSFSVSFTTLCGFWLSQPRHSKPSYSAPVLSNFWNAKHISLVNAEKCQLITTIWSILLTNPTLTSKWYALDKHCWILHMRENEGGFLEPQHWDFSRENRTLLGYYAASSGNFLPTFRDNLLVPSAGFKNPKSCTGLFG